MDVVRSRERWGRKTLAVLLPLPERLHMAGSVFFFLLQLFSSLS